MISKENFDTGKLEAFNLWKKMQGDRVTVRRTAARQGTMGMCGQRACMPACVYVQFSNGGWLQKQSHGRWRRWQRRVFWLDWSAFALCYGRGNGQVKRLDLLAVQEVERSTDERDVFCLVLQDGSTWTLRAPGTVEHWVDRVDLAVELALAKRRHAQKATRPVRGRVESDTSDESEDSDRCGGVPLGKASVPGVAEEDGSHGPDAGAEESKELVAEDTVLVGVGVDDLGDFVQVQARVKQLVLDVKTATSADQARVVQLVDIVCRLLRPFEPKPGPAVSVVHGDLSFPWDTTGRQASHTAPRT